MERFYGFETGALDSDPAILPSWGRPRPAVQQVGAVRAEAIRHVTAGAPAALWGVEWVGLLKEIDNVRNDLNDAKPEKVARDEEEETRAGSTNSDSEAEQFSISAKSPPDSTRNSVVGPIELSACFPKLGGSDFDEQADSEASPCPSIHGGGYVGPVNLAALFGKVEEPVSKPQGLSLSILLGIPPPGMESKEAAHHQRLSTQARPYVPQAMQSPGLPTTRIEPKVVPPPGKTPLAARSKLRSQAAAYVPRTIASAQENTFHWSQNRR